MISINELIADKSKQFYCSIEIRPPIAYSSEDVVEVKSPKDVDKFFSDGTQYALMRVENINHDLLLIADFHVSGQSDIDKIKKTVKSFLRSAPSAEDLKMFSLFQRNTTGDYMYAELRKEAIEHMNDHCARITAQNLGEWCYRRMSSYNDGKSEYYDIGDHFILRQKYDVPEDVDFCDLDNPDDLMYYEVDTKY